MVSTVSPLSIFIWQLKQKYTNTDNKNTSNTYEEFNNKYVDFLKKNDKFETISEELPQLTADIKKLQPFARDADRIHNLINNLNNANEEFNRIHREMKNKEDEMRKILEMTEDSAVLSRIRICWKNFKSQYFFGKELVGHWSHGLFSLFLSLGNGPIRRHWMRRSPALNTAPPGAEYGDESGL